jgi:hypothetical protein
MQRRRLPDPFRHHKQRRNFIMADVFAPGQAGFQIPNRPKDWFSYPVTFTTLANGVPQSTNLAIDAGSDFYMTALTFLATDAANTAAVTADTRIVPLVTILLTDSGSNRQLMQNPVPLDAIGGNGAWPHRLIHPRLFVRNSNIQVLVQSFDANVTYGTLRLNFEGFRIYS